MMWKNMLEQLNTISGNTAINPLAQQRASAIHQQVTSQQLNNNLYANAHTGGAGSLGMQQYLPSATSATSATSAVSGALFIPQWQAVTQSALQSEVFDTPLDTLVGLWLNRFGGDWVDMNDVVGDDFYSLAAQRMLQMARMESYVLSGVSKRVLRVLQ